jgi:microcystin-dependent protein
LFYDDSIAPGTVISAPTTKAPRGGWLLCQGGNISRDYYARLFAAIGTAHGAGNGITTFGLPDYRAEFLRGNDNGRGIDTGRVLGSVQGQAIQGHNHAIARWKQTGFDSTGGPNLIGSDAEGSLDTSINTDITGGTETRPRNVSTNFWIKY